MGYPGEGPRPRALQPLHAKGGAGGAGLVVPPQKVRAVADKTAQFAARLGPSFERRVLSELDPAKVSFIWPDDEYHQYYEHKKKEFAEALVAPRDGGEQAARSPCAPEEARASGHASFEVWGCRVPSDGSSAEGDPGRVPGRSRSPGRLRRPLHGRALVAADARSPSAASHRIRWAALVARVRERGGLPLPEARSEPAARAGEEEPAVPRRVQRAVPEVLGPARGGCPRRWSMVAGEWRRA